MAVRYNKLWKLLVDKKMSKADLRRHIDISPNTMTKLNREEMVALPILDKICETLGVDYGDIMEHVKDEQEDGQNA
ncbi:MAG: helix-turn-helix transcriptional regulator [Clostridia bacterium]|nr:helix-turn-helix transcriptional regulator [Clostridia bacterium]MBR6028401.1 helix-turn-helix transcriptional regulator [Clostridia bacterium]